jgi:hypothetical protein
VFRKNQLEKSEVTDFLIQHYLTSDGSEVLPFSRREISFEYLPKMNKKCTNCVWYGEKKTCTLRMKRLFGDWKDCIYWTENLNIIKLEIIEVAK